jgi:hypothetical protein
LLPMILCCSMSDHIAREHAGHCTKLHHMESRLIADTVAYHIVDLRANSMDDRFSDFHVGGGIPSHRCQHVHPPR